MSTSWDTNHITEHYRRHLTSLSLVTRAGAGAGHGGQGGQRGHRALAALGRPEAQARLAALEGLGAAVTEEAAASAPRIAGIISDYINSQCLPLLPLTHLTFLWAALWLLLSLRVRLSERLEAVWPEAEADLEPILSLRLLRISESLWVTVGCLTAWV